MQLLMEDMRQRLGADDITLPDAVTTDAVASGPEPCHFEIPAESSLATVTAFNEARDDEFRWPISSSPRRSIEVGAGTITSSDVKPSEEPNAPARTASHDGDKMVAGGLAQLSELRFSSEPRRRQSASSSGCAAASDIAAAAVAAAADRSHFVAQHENSHRSSAASAAGASASASATPRHFNEHAHRPAAVVMVEGHARMPSQMARG